MQCGRTDIDIIALKAHQDANVVQVVKKIRLSKHALRH